jgi:flagellin
MRINTNIEAFNAQRNLAATATQYAKSVQKLSSGLRINTAADDAAGLSISEKLRAQTKGLAQAQRNAQDGISLIQTGEGALNETHSILQRMRELTVQAANDTLQDADRDAIKSEMGQLSKEIDRIATSTQFNGKNLLDGSLSSDAPNTVKQTGLTGFSASPTTVTLDSTVKAGSFKVEVTAVATAATNSGSAAADTIGTKAGDTTTAAGDGKLSINGTDVSLTHGMSVSQVADAINNTAGVEVNATVESGKLKLTQKTAGATDSIDLTGSDANILTDLKLQDTDAGTTAGTDWAATVTAPGSNTADAMVFTGNSGAKDGVTVDFSGATATGSFTFNVGAAANLQIGANATQTLSVGVKNMDATALGVNDLDVMSSAAINASDGTLSKIDAAIAKVSDQRSTLGAYQNRLEHTISNLGVAQENLTASESRIRDVDMAAEMVSFTKTGILQQAGQAILAQANQSGQGVLSLLRG